MRFGTRPRASVPGRRRHAVAGAIRGSFLVLVLLALPSRPGASSGAVDSLPSVVSYLLRTGPDSTSATGGGVSRIPPHPWEWRLFDPRTGRDTLFLRLPALPVHLRWNPTFEYAEFILGNRIARVDWKHGSKIREVVTLPPDSLVWCDFWVDPAGAWHFFGQGEVVKHLSDGSVLYLPYGRRWDRSHAGVWSVAAVDSHLPGHTWCLPTDLLLQGAARVEAVTCQSLLNSMSLGSHRDSTLQEAPADSSGADARVWVASELDPRLGLEMGAAFGDTYHAFEPVVWVDRARGRRATVYAHGQSRDDTFGQLAFGERDGYALIVSEFEGGHPVVVDFRTGQVLLRVDRKSARAVWVPAPR